MLYASTFAPGFSQLIADVLPKTIGTVKIIKLFDGLIIYESEVGIDTIKGIKFFNNSYLVLNSWETRRKVEDLVKEILPIVKDYDDNGAIGKARRFRVFASVENTPRHIHNFFLTRLEKKISDKFNLHVNRALPDIEFWFVVRSERYSFFGIRLTKKASNEKRLSQGELRPELAHMLCLLSEPRKSDVVLDPFAGYGGIVMERSSAFAYDKIFAIEKDKQVFKMLKGAASGRKGVFISNEDFFTKSIISVDKVITDPPWGDFDRSINKNEFTKNLFVKLQTTVVSGGIVILLYSRDIGIGNYLKDTFKIAAKYDVLVSGKKSTVWKLIRV
jgi:tRNA G10  N-methylase Trm11